MEFPKLRVVFDDGREFMVAIRQADVVRLERHFKLSIERLDWGQESLMFLAWTALRREKVPDVPEDFDAFIDMVEIERNNDESEGKPTAPVQSTGS